MNSKKCETWAWDRYWQANRVASCAAAPGSNYQESLLSNWRKFFSTLPQSSAVLDICTGNGAIALVAAEQSHRDDKGFVIEAVDRADISPAEFIPDQRELLGEIEFHGETPVEDLPYDDANFDAVVSQYGIEYAENPAALNEATRVLRPGGRLRFVVHASEGYTVAAAKRDIVECDFLLKESNLFPLAREMFDLIWKGERAGDDLPPDQIYNIRDCVRRFKIARQAVESRAAETANPQIIQSTLALMADTYAKRAHFPLKTLLAKLSEAELEVLAHRRRLADMVAAAMSATELDVLADDLGQRGLGEVTAGKEFSSTDSSLIGHAIEAVKI